MKKLTKHQKVIVRSVIDHERKKLNLLEWTGLILFWGTIAVVASIPIRLWLGHQIQR